MGAEGPPLWGEPGDLSHSVPQPLSRICLHLSTPPSRFGPQAVRVGPGGGAAVWGNKQVGKNPPRTPLILEIRQARGGRVRTLLGHTSKQTRGAKGPCSPCRAVAWPGPARPRVMAAPQAPPPEPAPAGLPPAGCGHRAPPAGRWHFPLPLSNPAEQMPRQALRPPPTRPWRWADAPFHHSSLPGLPASPCPLPRGSCRYRRWILSHSPSHVPPTSLPFHRLQAEA